MATIYLLGHLVFVEGGEEQLPVRNNHILALETQVRCWLIQIKEECWQIGKLYLFSVTLFNYPDPIQVRGSEVGQIMEVFQVVLMRYLEKRNFGV